MTDRVPVPPEVDQVARAVVDAAFAVHSRMGPGLLESVYEVCLAYEIEKRGLSCQRQVHAPVLYDDLLIDSGLRIDLLVEDRLIIELKTVEKFTEVHVAQLLTYLKLMDRRLGLLINFNVALIKDGIKRVVC